MPILQNPQKKETSRYSCRETFELFFKKAFKALIVILAANKLDPKLNSFWCGSFEKIQGHTCQYFGCFQICMEVGLALSNPFVSVSWEKALDGDLTVPIAWLGRRPPTQCRSVAFSPVGSRLPGATHTSTSSKSFHLLPHLLSKDFISRKKVILKKEPKVFPLYSEGLFCLHQVSKELNSCESQNKTLQCEFAWGEIW